MPCAPGPGLGHLLGPPACPTCHLPLPSIWALQGLAAPHELPQAEWDLLLVRVFGLHVVLLLLPGENENSDRTPGKHQDLEAGTPGSRDGTMLGFEHSGKLRLRHSWTPGPRHGETSRSARADTGTGHGSDQDSNGTPARAHPHPETPRGSNSQTGSDPDRIPQALTCCAVGQPVHAPTPVPLSVPLLLSAPVPVPDPVSVLIPVSVPVSAPIPVSVLVSVPIPVFVAVPVPVPVPGPSFRHSSWGRSAATSGFLVPPPAAHWSDLPRNSRLAENAGLLLVEIAVTQI